ncbi:Ribulose-5-phosphate 4-epimerase/Fuculose-1-phosphate aldolase [Roseateles sp. YR242]|uniref:class II aldolase/adducin family protein n=1 Tax=Roseateles sp. YR242 TaxID=1855305 RepID=UPI0008D1BD7B|nr:class II aldolase/adducin family protein [Roseateles sp. YR242]SEK62134.1 Ribulose-5-phosphate 4-epimerase/Fuculose-1-phosphate aldolase [Roseateles sp. YR242]
MSTSTPARARTEAEVRVDLAAAYRLAALAGWDDTVYTHLSATVPGEPGVYLINEFGLGFDEVCASNLVKVDVHGRVVDGTNRRVNPSGFAIHGAVHAGRPDVACVVHLHAPWGVALAMVPGGLQPTSQWAMRLYGRLGRHPYEGLALGPEEQQRLVAHLGALDGLILENHGTLTVGRSVAEAYMLMHILERAAQAQLQAMAATGGRIQAVNHELASLTHRQWVGDASEWDGDVEWPALLRRLDRRSPGFRE